jgi:hypothetical protein
VLYRPEAFERLTEERWDERRVRRVALNAADCLEGCSRYPIFS